MDQAPEETKEPEFRLFQEGTTLEEIAFKRSKLPEKSKREKVVEAFQDVFELVGGVPRMALYADQNYGDFFSKYAKMLPRDVDVTMKGTITIVPALPPSALDGEFECCGPSETLDREPAPPQLQLQPPSPKLEKLATPVAKSQRKGPKSRDFVEATVLRSKPECG